MKWRKLARVALLFAFGAVVARSEIIFDNGGTLFQGGLLSTVDTHFLVADDFVLESGTNILNDIHWWGYYAETDLPPTDSFTAYIYSDAGSEPGAVLFTLTDPVLRTDTGGDAFGTYTEFEYHMDISALELTAGTTYWLAIQNDVDCNWFWSITDFATGNAHQKLQLWHDYEVEEAFYLTGPDNGVVPEPASVMLMGFGLVAVAVGRKSWFVSKK